MLKLPQYIIHALNNGETSLGKHPSFPPEEEELFTVGLLNNFFDFLTDGIDAINVDELKSKLAEALTECKKIENKHIDDLEKLCANTVNEIFNIPDNTLKIEMNIVNNIDTKNERIVPEKTVGFTFDDINDMNNLTDEVYKRRMLNSLVVGAAMSMSENIGLYIKGLFEIDSELPSLYKKIFKLNNILLYLEKESFNKDEITDGGNVDVNISSPMNIVEIYSQGVLMPILLEETIKGILELAISHGLPKDAAKAQYVLSKSDFKLAEVWDMRLGLPLWLLIEHSLKEQGIELNEVGANYLLMEIARLDVEDFNLSLKEIFRQTKKGKYILSDIVNSIINQKEEDEFSNYMNNKNSDAEIIGDEEYYNPEELITDSEIVCEAAQQLISPEEAEKQGFAIPKEHLSWKEGEFKQPTKKEIGYKVFALIDGKLYPPVVANKNGQDTPIGKWLPCSCPPIIGYTISEHRPQVKTGGKGTARDLGNLSFRPGWHLGLIPFASQFCYKLNASEKLMIDGRYVFPDNFVFAECEYQADNDLSDECYKNGLTKSGKYQHSRAGIPKIPKNAFYRYRTNVDPSTADWIITGAIKVNKILSREEVDALNAKNGIKPLIYANKKQAEQLKKQLLQQNNANIEGNAQEKESVRPIKTESKKRTRIRKNDKGDIVPQKCKKCGADIKLYIEGEPIYRCSNEKCGKYYGTVPFK